MATQAGALVAAIGTKLAATFPTYLILYGLPDDSGTYVGTGNRITIRWTEEDAQPAGNMLGGLVTVRPRVMIVIRRPFAADSTTLATHQATIDLCADVRQAVMEMVLANADGTAPISGVGGSLWITDARTTPAVLDIGTGSEESATVEFGFRLTRNYGGR